MYSLAAGIFIQLHPDIPYTNGTREYYTQEMTIYLPFNIALTIPRATRTQTKPIDRF